MSASETLSLADITAFGILIVKIGCRFKKRKDFLLKVLSPIHEHLFSDKQIHARKASDIPDVDIIDMFFTYNIMSPESMFLIAIDVIVQTNRISKQKLRKFIRWHFANSIV